MASETLQDSVVLDHLLQQALSPITNYSQGVLSLALAKKSRDQQLADAQRIRTQQLEDATRRRGEQLADVKESERFTTEQSVLARQAQEQRDAQQHMYEMERLSATNQGFIDREKEIYQIASDQKKKDLVEQQKAEAVANGIELPEGSTFEDYVKANANATGEKITAAIKTVHSTSQALADARGQTREELRRDQMSRAIGDLEPNVKHKLSASQLNALITDPQEIVRLMDQAARTNNRDLMTSLADINGKVQQATSEMMTKAVADKAIVQDMKDQNDTAQLVLQGLMKSGKYPPSAIIDAFKGYGQAAVGKPQASATPASRVPQLPGQFIAPSPVSAPVQSTLTPVTPQAMQSMENIPDVSSANLVSQLGQVPQLSPTQARLGTFLQQQSNAQSALTPTAFPGSPNTQLKLNPFVLQNQ